MVSCLYVVYLLSFYFTGLYDGSMPNLCSIISLGTPGISDICHAKTSRLSQRKVMSVSSYLGSSVELIRSFFVINSLLLVVCRLIDELLIGC
jgi:hypothetical protein